MTLQADFGASLAVDLIGFAGESVSYTPIGGTPATESAIVERQQGIEERDEQGSYVIEEALVLIAPLAPGGASRGLGDAVAIDSKDFGVAGITRDGGSGLVELRVVAVEKTRVERQDAVVKRRR